MPLSAKQEKLLGQLMLQPTVAEAAAAAGYTERNAFYLLAHPAFATAYRQLRQEALSHAMTLLQAASGKAVGALVELVEDTAQPGAVRASAAGKLLELAFRSGEGDLRAELAEIRAELQEHLRDGGAEGRWKVA